MRKLILVFLLLYVLSTNAAAAELPEDVMKALPEQAEVMLEDVDFFSVDAFSGGLIQILKDIEDEIGGIIRQRLHGVASIFLIVILYGVLDGLYQGVGEKQPLFLPVVGVLSVTALAAGSLDSLIGLGAETMGELSLFSKALLPTLAAATAASGAVTTATVHQVTTVFLVELLLNLIHNLILPLVYVYIGLLAAASCLPENRLGNLAEILKKTLTWILTTALLAFTLYLSISRIVSGAADGMAVKVTKAAISGVVPVVGGIIAEASETVLLGAGMLKNSIGIFGMLGILAACAYPFLQLGVQYLLYKLTAFFASVIGAPELYKFIDGLGGVFGLILGMTGACALLLLVSIFSSVAAVMP